MNEQELSVPQSLYLYLKAVGHVKDKTGKMVYLADHNLPVTVAQGIERYLATQIDMDTHKIFEGIPCLGVCGDVLMAQSTQNNVAPNIRLILQPGMTATQNLAGFFEQAGSVKEEIRIQLDALGITEQVFSEFANNSRPK